MKFHFSSLLPVMTADTDLVNQLSGVLFNEGTVQTDTAILITRRSALLFFQQFLKILAESRTLEDARKNLDMAVEKRHQAISDEIVKENVQTC